MTIFIDPEFNRGVCLNITGEKAGTIHGATADEVCCKLLKHLAKDDTAYIDIHGVGIVIADILSQYINVCHVNLKKSDIIKE